MDVVNDICWSKDKMKAGDFADLRLSFYIMRATISEARQGRRRAPRRRFYHRNQVRVRGRPGSWKSLKKR